MARNTERSSRRSAKDAARRTKKKPCALCRDQVQWVDYKDVNLLRKYMSDRGKIRARRVSGNCAQHQRDIALAIKTARELILLPYTTRTMTERSGGRRAGRGDRFGGGRGPRTESDQAPRAGGDGSAEAAPAADADGTEPGAEPESAASQVVAADSASTEAGAEAGSESQPVEAASAEGRR